MPRRLIVPFFANRNTLTWVRFIVPIADFLRTCPGGAIRRALIPAVWYFNRPILFIARHNNDPLVLESA